MSNMSNSELACRQAKSKFDEANAEFVGQCKSNPIYATEWKLNSVIEAQVDLELATEILEDALEQGDVDWSRDSDEQFETNLTAWLEQFPSRSLAHMRGEAGSTSGATRLVENIRDARRARFYANAIEERKAKRQRAEREANQLEADQAAGRK